MDSSGAIRFEGTETTQGQLMWSSCSSCTIVYMYESPRSMARQLTWKGSGG